MTVKCGKIESIILNITIVFNNYLVVSLYNLILLLVVVYNQLPTQIYENLTVDSPQPVLAVSGVLVAMSIYKEVLQHCL